MKAHEIRVGGTYLARVSGKITTVRVDALRTGRGVKGNQTYYDVTNLSTRRRTTFRSAAKFRSEVAKATAGPQTSVGKFMARSAAEREAASKSQEGEKRADPTPDKTAANDAQPASTLHSSRATVGSATELGGEAPPCVEAADRAEQNRLAAIRDAGRNDDEQEDENSTDPTSSSQSRAATSAGSSTTAATPATTHSGSGLAGALARRATAEVDSAPHVQVPALAGSGKTTCIIEGVKTIKGLKSGLIPSEQQAEVWRALGVGRSDSVRLSAFSTKITDELKSRLKAGGLDNLGVEAKGIHSLGLAAVTKRFGRLSAENSKWVVPEMAAAAMGVSFQSVKGTKQADQVWAVDTLVSLCKQTLTEPTPENLDRLSSRFNVDLNGGKQAVYDLVPEVLKRCLTPENGQITYDDMIWLAIRHDLPIYRVDVQIIDEVQDLNRMQQELMYRAGHRIVMVGDRNQSIMGFAGADTESMDRMRAHLDGTGRGCEVIPLTVTRRCGKAIVKEAQRFVPEYEAHPDNPEGRVSRADCEEFKRTSGQLTNGLAERRGLRDSESDYRKLAAAGDFVLCRTNAPLVSQCFKFIRDGRKAIILGKKIGEGLTSLVGKSKARAVPDLIAWLGDWLAKETANENAKRYPSEGRLDNLRDRYDCLLSFCEGLSDVGDVTRKIGSIFTDSKEDCGITLSSIHKSKGLEARRVFLLQPPQCGPRRDKMQAWEVEQERHLSYVAITRAIEELVYVS